MMVVAVATPVYDDHDPALANIPPVVASPHSPEQLAMRQRNHCVGHFLRTVGWLCIVLAVCEVGVGGAIYSFFDNVHFGTWMASFLCIDHPTYPLILTYKWIEYT